MKLAAAQFNAKVGDLEGNLAKHTQMIKQASGKGVDLIVFPEMSITGYCMEEGSQLAFNESDPRIRPLVQLSKENQINIFAGAPIKMQDRLFIGAFVIQPNGTTSIYSKHFLHPGEEKFYHYSFGFDPILQIKSEKIAFAICADIEHEQHPQAVKDKGGSLYIASIFYSAAGMEGGLNLLKSYAKKYGMPVLSANYYGQHWNLESGGSSSFWDKNGKLIGQLEEREEGLLIVEKIQDSWRLVHP